MPLKARSAYSTSPVPSAASAFFAQKKPSKKAIDELADLSPSNPFCTWSYLVAMEKSGREPWLIGLKRNDSIESACTAFVRRDRFGGSLSIPSMDRSGESPSFCRGLLEVCRAERVFDVDIASYGARVSVLPELPGAELRMRRKEHVIRLQGNDLFQKLHHNHKRSVARAQKSGLKIIRTTGGEVISSHIRVLEASLRRRKERGESVPSVQDGRVLAALVAAGAGEFFQAVDGPEVLASVFVLRSKCAGYMHSSGATADGMQRGASHFLEHEISKILQAEGMLEYSLGGTTDEETGLFTFKSRFGGEQIELEKAEYYVGSRVRRKTIAVLRSLKRHPKRLVTRLLGSSTTWVVHSAMANEVPPPGQQSRAICRKLSDDDFRSLVMPEQFRREQLERLVRMGHNGAYGVISDGKLVHVSWLILPAYDHSQDMKLRRDEAEITACETLPEFRGRGLYPFAIRTIAADAARMGVRRLLMKTSPSNEASRRGIRTAGLAYAGKLIVIASPLMPGRRFAMRTFRTRG